MEQCYDNTLYYITKYVPPPWFCNMKVEPPRFQAVLAMKPTPIQYFEVPGLPDGFSISFKRDDMTGSTLTGNKVRKLEFLLADAKSRGCTDVITSGSTQSNHARATLISAKQLGMECHLVLRDLEKNCDTVTPDGNFLMMEMAEPNVYLLPWDSFMDDTVLAKERTIASSIEQIPGKKVYIIPPGGDSAIGIFGYIDAWNEMLAQKVDERFDDIIIPTGTTGTTFGIALGNYLTGSKVRIHGVTVSRTKQRINQMISASLQEFGLQDVTTEDIIDVIDGIGQGYSKYGKDEIEFCKLIASTTGLYCDPVYVGKALKCATSELHNNPNRFKGKRILFLHTGGVFSLLEKRAAELITSKTAKAKIRQVEEVYPEAK